MVTTSEQLDEQPPPAYTEVAPLNAPPPPPINMPSGSSSFASSPPAFRTLLVPSTNFLTVVRNNDPIKGRYVIDPSMLMPPSVVPSIGDDGRQLNMRAVSQNGSVDLAVEVVCRGEAKGPARLQASSRNGSIAITVHDNAQKRFRLKVTSGNGTVSVRIPLTYLGTVSTCIRNSRVTFGPRVGERLTTFSEQGKEGYFFIGDYASSGYGGDEMWLGDHLRVESTNGSVKIDFVGEENKA